MRRPRRLNVAAKTVPRLHSRPRSKNYGVIFCVTLLLVITITNIPLRGMWSVVVIITVIMMSVIFALAGWWEWIFDLLSVPRYPPSTWAGICSSRRFPLYRPSGCSRCSSSTSRCTSSSRPGQFKVCTEIGGGEKVYDTVGMKLERQRSDLFRHMILGLGSGDLIVKTSGASPKHFDLPNALFISKKVQQIEDMLQKRGGRHQLTRSMKTLATRRTGGTPLAGAANYLGSTPAWASTRGDVFLERLDEVGGFLVLAEALGLVFGFFLLVVGVGLGDLLVRVVVDHPDHSGFQTCLVGLLAAFGSATLTPAAFFAFS